ncbi:hypothetical protein EMVG_00085 [Emiliania huxleyi virus PS401]|nr:hypothetical protein EMVG_00085 [Emiliania huxleyi virus PS401]
MSSSPRPLRLAPELLTARAPTSAAPPAAAASPSPPRSSPQKTVARRSLSGGESPPAPTTPSRKALAQAKVSGGAKPPNAKVGHYEAKRNTAANTANSVGRRAVRLAFFKAFE